MGILSKFLKAPVVSFSKSYSKVLERMGMHGLVSFILN